MAILNGLYIHVVSESLIADMETTTHPVEEGIPLTDTVRAKPVVISLSGKIVDYGSTKATEAISKIKSLKDSGSLIEYRGRNVASSMQIEAFETSHPNTNSGGADFMMELKQVRIAKSAYVPKKPSETEKEAAAKTPEVVKKVLKVGDKCIFTGGPVYVSSDAKKKAATRERSTCEVLYTNARSWSIHPYCLKSLDGKMVYGWVDTENIEGAEMPTTSSKTNAGTQQTAKATVSGPTKKAVGRAVSVELDRITT